MLKKTTHFLILLCFLALSIPAHAVGLTIDKTRTINMVTVTQDANTGDYTIVTTGTDPYFFTSALPAELDESADSLTFEYKASQDLDDFQLFYCEPISEERSQHFPDLIKKTDVWTKVSISLKEAKEKFDWTHAGNYLRFDLGNKVGVTVQLRNLYINVEDMSLTPAQKSLIARHINTYTKRMYNSLVNSVTVQADNVTIAGTCEKDGRKYALVEVPPYTDVTEETNFEYRTDITDKDFSITLPRYCEHGSYTKYDRLLSKWAIVDCTNGKDSLVSSARYADDVTPLNSPEPGVLTTKKGLGGFYMGANKEDLSKLGIGSVTVNLVLNSLVSVTPNNSYLKYSYGGKTYYMNRSTIQSLDQTFKYCQTNNALVSVILLVTPSGGDAKYTGYIRHPEYTSGPYTMPNFRTIDGVEAYAATIEFLANRYSRTKNGRIHHWILHNEVDQGDYWTNMGSQPIQRYVDTYMKSMRLVYNIVRQYDQNASVLASFTHSWTAVSGSSSYTTKKMLEIINQFSSREGDFRWGLAYHPYPEDLTKPEFWKNDIHSTYDIDQTGYITFKNLEVISDWTQNPANKYKGTEKRLLFLSEQGTNSPSYSAKNLKLQAAGACWAWKKVAKLKGIDAMQWHNWQDNREEGGLRIGLRYYPDDADHPGEPKPVWYVWQAAGTEKEDSVFDGYKSTLGIASWNQIFQNVIGAVDKPATDKSALNVYGTQGAIVVKTEKPVAIYTLTGTLVAKTATDVNVPAGIYIVRGNSQSKKVIVR